MMSGQDGDAERIHLQADIVREEARLRGDEPRGHRAAGVRGRAEDRFGAAHEADARVVEVNSNHHIRLGSRGDGPALPPPPGGGLLRLAALRDEAEAAVVGAAAPEAREQPHGQGPRPAGGERLPEQEGCVGEVRRFAEEGSGRGGRQ